MSLLQKKPGQQRNLGNVHSLIYTCFIFPKLQNSSVSILFLLSLWLVWVRPKNGVFPENLHDRYKYAEKFLSWKWFQPPWQNIEKIQKINQQKTGKRIKKPVANGTSTVLFQRLVWLSFPLHFQTKYLTKKGSEIVLQKCNKVSELRSSYREHPTRGPHFIKCLE